MGNLALGDAKAAAATSTWTFASLGVRIPKKFIKENLLAHPQSPPQKQMSSCMFPIVLCLY
jgi:hypothetical protein